MLTDGRGTTYDLVSDRQFFGDENADATMSHNPASCIITFDTPITWLEDTEVLDLAERVKQYQRLATIVDHA